ncbi:hypothetical protein BDV96DRAFT_17274 [Lophiotrema nucula]|uniref:Beta-lactamase-related domain-containing protein n=1 Tax=Lophiotrema nucula TaxID=690887 RepID=A0A6A5ZCS6_9PLEO|nr:hypothetical protein BDV96DRAFT_17274 [Lophiotrema nucula]
MDTCYKIGTLTQAFIAASCRILVDEKKLSWERPMQDYIPFHLQNDPYISKRATVADALSHSIGLPPMDVLLYDANGTGVVALEDFFHAVAHLPVDPNISDEARKMKLYTQDSEFNYLPTRRVFGTDTVAGSPCGSASSTKHHPARTSFD